MQTFKISLSLMVFNGDSTRNTSMKNQSVSLQIIQSRTEQNRTVFVSVIEFMFCANFDEIIL